MFYKKSLDEAVARDPALVLQSNTRVVRESNPLNLSVFTDVLQTGSQVIFQNDRRSYVSEDLRRSIQAELRRSDLHQSRAGGTRTHDFRLIMLYSNSAVDRCNGGDEEFEQIHFQVGVEPTST